MEILVVIILLIFGILQIILFFKLWGMTNNVREIKKMMLKANRENPPKKKLDINTEPAIKNAATISAPASSWAKDVSEDDKINAQRIIPTLVSGEIIIKLSKSGKMVVYNTDNLHELVNEDYQAIYYK